MTSSDRMNSGNTRHQFGTFSGVFTPSLLAILGVIMFLRAGFVTGEAGIKGALLILFLAEAIVLLTALSVAAISTNTPVRGGGAYYLISRVLGPEFGGAIGLTLFSAQAISVPFYLLGFAEALVQGAPSLDPHFRWICLGTATLLFGLNYLGAGWALKVQFLVLSILGLSIIIFLGGAALQFETAIFRENWEGTYRAPHSFWVLFAIYFPAVTGIMAGINMSGDLKTPGRSIVRGTFAAILVGASVYALQIVLLGGSQPRADLVERPYGVLLENALLGAGFLVVAGMISATLSSALSSFMASPRVMQAIARDHIIPVITPMGAGSKRGDEPKRAIILTYLITVSVIWVASGEGHSSAFNLVASIVTMFFLCTYGIINLAAFVEAFSSNPSFRPRFKFFHWSSALVGTVGCVVTMALIDVRAAALAFVLIASLYLYMNRTLKLVAFGDARRGFFYAAVSKNLLRLRAFKPHPKTWRPTILVLSGNPDNRLNLILYGVWLEAGRGIVTVAQLITGNLRTMMQRRREAQDRLDRFVEDNNLNVFHEVVIAEDFDEGVRLLLQSHSIGPIKPNIVLMGWPSDPERVVPFVRHLRDIRMLGMSALSILEGKKQEKAEEPRIDIWWRGQENGSLMLILAHLLSHNWEWNRSHIRVLRLVNESRQQRDAHVALATLVESARIPAEVNVVVGTQSFDKVLKEQSHDAAVIFMGFQPVREDSAVAFHDYHQGLLGDMPTTIIVSSSGEADLFA